MGERDDDPDPSTSTPFDSVVGRVEAQLARGRPSGALDPPSPAPVAIVRRGRGDGARDYATGIAIGIAVVGVLLQIWVGYEVATYRTTWEMFAPESLRPSAAGVVASTAWRYGAPVVLAGLVGLAHVLAGRGRRWPALVIAVVAVAAPVTTLYVARAPFHAVADAIETE
jgi:hypothetical protein